MRCPGPLLLVVFVAHTIAHPKPAGLTKIDPGPSAWQKLNRPTLETNLNYLNESLANNDYMPTAGGAYSKWQPGWIPGDCNDQAKQRHVNPADIEVFNVTFSDCHTPWQICRDRNSPHPLNDLLVNIGRVPVKARSYVRHFMELVDPTFHGAYNEDGNIVLFNDIGFTPSVYIHETGHSLDCFGGYGPKPLSNSTVWMENYNKDSAVPDQYSDTMMVENCAQMTIVATFDLNVPGGYPKVEKNWQKVEHQYKTLEALQHSQGDMLKHGGQCGQRLENSMPVAVSSHSKRTPMPDVSLPNDIEVIEPRRFSTKGLCSGL